MVGLTICTAGWGAEYVATHWASTSTAIAKGAGAALEGITNTLSVSTLANGGDLGKVFKEISNSNYLKNLVASAVSAGLVSKFVPDTDKKLPFSAHATRNLKKAAINTATSTAANGGKVARNALSAATGAMVDADAASVAQEIGRAYRNGSGDMSWLTHKICHFVLGGGSAALRGEDPLSGAIGATIGEVAAEAMDKPGASPEIRQKIANKARFIGDTAAFLAGRDIASTDSAGRTAVENNYRV